MKKGMIVLIILAVVVIGALFMAISTYNNLISESQRVDSANAEINNQLKRRSDLIPNLVQTVKGYADHEKEVLDRIAEAREQLTNASTTKGALEANNQLSSALSRLLVVVENYPDLKANTQFQGLMDELSGTENRIATARRDYNTVVQNYNTMIKKVPQSLFAGLLGFHEKPYYEIPDVDVQRPDVTF